MGGAMELNVKTLFLINVAVLFLSAVTASYFWRQYRDNVWLLWWSLATGLGAAALLFVGLFGPVPPVAIGAPAGVMLFACYVLIWQSMRVFNGRPLHALRLIAIVFAFVAVFAVVVAFGASVGHRAQLLTAGLMMFAGLASYEVWRGARDELPRARLVMAGLFAVMAIVLAARTALPWLSPESELADVFYDPLGGLSSLVNSISIVGLSIALLMMANERTSDRHRRLALTDELTGLPNRRYFLTQAELLLRRHGRDTLACILMMDLDRFSKVNQRFGHAGGDEALVWFASLLRRQLRSSDLVARYGGEEFCALLMSANQAQALATAERIRASLAAEPVAIQGQRHPVTVSIGVALLRSGEIAAALQKADQALYRAKAEGRNRVAAEQGFDVRLAAN